MLAWFVFFVCLIFGLRDLLQSNSILWIRSGELSRLAQTRDALHSLEDALASGCLPVDEDWQRLASQPKPWGQWISTSLQELRKHGAQILPTVKRFRALVVSHERSLREGNARSSQALSQALICFLLIPFFSSFLYLMVPGVDEKRGLWIFFSLLMALWGGMAALWMLSMAEQARWGGLKREEQPWVLEALGFSERLLALMRAGLSPDVAWAHSSVHLSANLCTEWGADVWQKTEFIEPNSQTLRGSIEMMGEKLRRAIQVSLLEGKPCEERLQAVIESFRIEMSAYQEKELSLLGSRALKPLFLCVAPAILSLLGLAIFLSFKSQAVGWF